VERNLGVIQANNSNYRNPGYLLRKAYNLASTDLVPSDSVFTIIERLPSPLKEEMNNAVSTMLASLEHYYWMKHSQEINRHAATPQNPRTDTTTTQLTNHPYTVVGGELQSDASRVVSPNVILAREQAPSAGSRLHVNNPYQERTIPAAPPVTPVHLDVLRKLTPYQQKYTFPTNTSKKNAKQLATYMFLLVTDVIKLASFVRNIPNSTSTSSGNEQYDKFLRGKQLVDCGHSNPTCKGFWIKKGMNNFSKCLIVHHSMDFHQLYTDNGDKFSNRNSPYKCHLCSTMVCHAINI
jgi:hypothetical protein